jgi:hypothetical protein
MEVAERAVLPAHKLRKYSLPIPIHHLEIDVQTTVVLSSEAKILEKVKKYTKEDAETQ